MTCICMLFQRTIHFQWSKEMSTEAILEPLMKSIYGVSAETAERFASRVAGRIRRYI